MLNIIPEVYLYCSNLEFNSFLSGFKLVLARTSVRIRLTSWLAMLRYVNMKCLYQVEG